MKNVFRLFAIMTVALVPLAAHADDDCGDVRSSLTCGIWQSLDASGSCTAVQG